MQSGIEELIPPLVMWYRENKRDLPWRRDCNPYHVWVSEIMLQQTRVEAVKPYYKAFMEAFPTIETLAMAQEERLLKYWEGLGYYSRVRNMQKAAQTVVSEYNGVMPGEASELLQLCGIGSYTAGAIASICFDEPVPAVDGNVFRVLARVRQDNRDISLASTRKSIEAELKACYESFLPESGFKSGELNQALMELGAVVCAPNGAPKCSECPLCDRCGANRAGETGRYPVKAAPKPRRIEKRTVLVIRDENSTILNKRPRKGLLAGLYELPAIEGHVSENEVQEFLSGQGIKILRIRRLPDAKHVFSHIEWHMKAYLIHTDELDKMPSGEISAGWIHPTREMLGSTIAIPSAFEAYRPFIIGSEDQQTT